MLRARYALLCCALLAFAGLDGAQVADAGAAAASGVAAVPHPDHVVVVVEENHSNQSILGNANAPYINSLAASGATMTKMFAETHPSQPNYLALFSGSTQGVTDDSCPHTVSAPNLGASLLDAGLTFAGYSETMPSAGYTGCSSGNYARKHNPWVNFSNVPASANQPLTSFPTDYSTLPAVSFVIPNLQNDMHDGTIAQGDQWLKNNLDGYVQWAQTHNSVLVLTFDEDDGGQGNQIPTVITGQRVVGGSYSETANHYNLLRTIEDGFGLAPVGASASAAPIVDIWSAPAGDQPPSPAFTSTCTQLSCSFDGSTSTDSDGSIASYTWDFGDGTSATGATASHTYPAAGTFSARLTVVDDQGAPASITHSVTVSAPAGAPFVSDGFGRTVANGLGTADIGGLWTTVGIATQFSVAPGAAALNAAKAGAQLEGYLGPAQTDADVATTFRVDKMPVGGPIYLTLSGRRVSTGNNYLAKLIVNPNGSMTIRLSRVVGGTETAVAGPVAVPGSFVAGTDVAMRLQVTGTNPTTLRARTWPVAQAEPTTWQVSTTDTTSGLQTGGRVGLIYYLSGAATNAPVKVSSSGFVAKPTAAPPANQPPTASFSSSCTQLTCTVDGSASSDQDGTIASYSWAFGDNGTGSGASLTHGYATAGTYQITLTVTDDKGATGTLTRSVTATDPPPNQPPVAAFTSSCSGLTCAFDASTSADSDGTITTYAWGFGDGGSAATPTTQHTFAAAGSYQVTLGVTDDDQASATTSHTVTVTATPAAFVLDTFNRTVTSGLGTADTGGAWTTIGTAAQFAVSPGASSWRPPKAGAQLEGYLGPARTDADVLATLSLDKVPTAGPDYVSVSARRVATGTSYTGQLLVNANGTVSIKINKIAGGTTTALTSAVTVAGVTASPSTPLSVRVQAVGTGPTTLRAKVWAASSAEPAAWQVTASDATAALQTGGTVGLVDYLSSAATNAPVTLSLSGFSARPSA